MKHGEAKRNAQAPEHRAWVSMRQRCENPAGARWERYGGRGIRVCKRWRSFTAFLADVGRRPSPDHSLDRINLDGHYMPSNVRWATRCEQQQNTRKNTYLVINGRRRCIDDWARLIGMPRSTLRMRLKRGWSPESAISIAPSHKNGAARRLGRIA